MDNQCAEDENFWKRPRLKVYVAMTFDSDVISEIWIAYCL